MPDIDGLHIVQLVPTPVFAGTERYAVNLSIALARRGARVSLVGGDTQLVPAYLAETGSDVGFLPAHNLITGARRLLGLRGADLVHAHLTTAEVAAVSVFPRHPRPTRRAGARRGWMLEGPAVVSTRHIAARRGASRAGAWAAPWVRRRLDGQVAISQFVADAIDGASVVIPTGVPDQELGPHADLVVLLAQRLQPEKDTATAVRAWAASKLFAEGWQLHIAGTGAQEGELRSLASQLGVSGSCHFLGQVGDVPERMAQAGIFLATASAEPFGLSVVEAMATGLPVVATASGGHLETVGRAPGAALFRPGDHLAAATHLRELAANREPRAAYGQALRRLQQTEFAMEGFVDRIATWYTSVLTTTERGSGTIEPSLSGGNGR